MSIPKKKPLSVYGLLIVGLILVIEPALPWYYFSPFWFGLGVLSVAIALYDIFGSRRTHDSHQRDRKCSRLGNSQ